MRTKRSYDLTLCQIDYGIGNTPMQAISLIVHGIKRVIHLKLEGYNPTHSIKDRTAYALVQALEDQGVSHRDSALIESTSGNLGVALARLCEIKGYRFLAIVDPKATAENIAKMHAFEAQIEMVTEADETGSYLLTRLAYIRQFIKTHTNYIWTDQYTNPANPNSHYMTTGPEIYKQMQGRVDVIFTPVSTGGTLAGIGTFFREVSPLTQIIGVDAFGSVIFNTPSAPRKLTGIGSSQTSKFINKEIYDESIIVKDEGAFAFCRFLFASTGIAVGGSSGATLAACARYLAQHTEKPVLFVFVQIMVKITVPLFLVTPGYNNKGYISIPLTLNPPRPFRMMSQAEQEKFDIPLRVPLDVCKRSY